MTATQIHPTGWTNLLPDPLPAIWEAAETGNREYPREPIIGFLEYSETHPEEQDRLFNQMTRFWTIARNGVNNLLINRQSERFYDLVLAEVHEWEDRTGKKIHKGTPYYFLGVICLLNGNIEKGLLAMHQAAAEDFRGGATARPAIHFIHLDDTVQEQFFRPYVQKGAAHLQNILAIYCKNHNRNVGIEKIRANLLANPTKKEYAWYFASLVYRLQARSEIAPRLRDNPLGSYLGTSLLFDMCRLFEVLLSLKYEGKLPRKIRSCAQASSSECTLEGNIEKFNALMSDVNTSVDTIRKLLNRTFSDPGITLQGTLAYDLALTYSFRNFGGHSITDHSILRTDFERIAQSIMSAILFSVELLPPSDTASQP